jgi:hypothetical protein
MLHRSDASRQTVDMGQFQTHAAHIFFGTIERGFDFPAIISVRQD